jgi:hypothetical protein
MKNIIKLTLEKNAWYANGIETRFGTYAKPEIVLAEHQRLFPGATITI